MLQQTKIVEQEQRIVTLFSSTGDKNSSGDYTDWQQRLIMIPPLPLTDKTHLRVDEIQRKTRELTDVGVSRLDWCALWGRFVYILAFGLLVASAGSAYTLRFCLQKKYSPGSCIQHDICAHPERCEESIPPWLSSNLCTHGRTLCLQSL